MRGYINIYEHISRRKVNMAVLQIVTLTKSGVEFSTVLEAVDSFKADNLVKFQNNESFNQNSQESGDLTQTNKVLTEDKTGYISNNTWSDTKWNEITKSKTYLPNTDELSDTVSLSEFLEGWEKNVDISYIS